MTLLSIDGQAMPTPTDYKVQYSDLDSSDTGRTEDGQLLRSRVRAGIAKISLKWELISTADCEKILTATGPDSMQVDYFFGTTHTAQMYAGDRTAQLHAAREGSAVWTVEMNLIEY